MAYRTGLRIVEMVREDLKPSDILTRAAFENAIVVSSAIGGSTNAPIHLGAIARHVGVDLPLDDWQRLGHGVPLLVDLQPAGKYLGEEFHRAGGVPAVVHELMRHGLVHEDAPTVNGRTLGDNCRDAEAGDRDVIRTFDTALTPDAGFLVLQRQPLRRGDHEVQRDLAGVPAPVPGRRPCYEGTAVVFDGPEDYHARIDEPDLGVDEHSLLVMRGTGPLGYPGSAEVVNMRPPAELIKRGVHELPCLGDGRQSGTSGSPSILNASPEAAAGGGLAVLRTGDRVRIDLGAGTADVLISDEELARRHRELAEAGGYPVPESQTPWQEIQRSMVDQLCDGMVLRPAVAYQRIAATKGIPRDNH